MFWLVGFGIIDLVWFWFALLFCCFMIVRLHWLCRLGLSLHVDCCVLLDCAGGVGLCLCICGLASALLLASLC